jgi:two-component system, NtrC family, nitrogen regulation response regulator GlnG
MPRLWRVAGQRPRRSGLAPVDFLGPSCDHESSVGNRGDVSDETTLNLSGLAATIRGLERAPYLTVIAHPDSSRIGERARVDPGPCGIGRNAPTFYGGDPHDARPLEDRFLSRRPVMVELGPSGVLLDPAGSPIELRADGIPIHAPTVLPADALEAGVVLDLSGRVALFLQDRLSTTGEDGALGLVGNSAAIESVRRDIRRVSDLDVPVLIRGETGVGKELVALALHRASLRADRAYEAVNMAAVPQTLAASELFGHEKGAFSGADKRRAGFFERADGGTLFLDEVGDTPSEIQALLLRALETGEIQAVGGQRTLRVNVRLIAATDADLEVAVAAGRFRQPLLHRLSGYQIHVPALRERREDVGRLFYHFVRGELATLGDSGRLEPNAQTPWIPASLVARLTRYDWPGNVRQLRNVARQLVIAHRDAPQMMPDEGLLGRLIPVGGPDTVPMAPLKARSPATPAPARYRKPSDIGEEELIKALRAHQWRLGPAAKSLHISRTTLYALVEASSRVRKATDISPSEIEATVGGCGGDLATAAAAMEVSLHALKLRMNALGLK